MSFLKLFRVPDIPSRGKDSWESFRTALTCLVIMTFAAGSVRGSGVLYYGMVEKLGATREEASWPISLMGAMLSLSMSVWGPLAQKFSPRPVMIGGAVLAVLSMMSCYFVNSTQVLTVTFGFFFGSGIGCIYTTNVIFLQQSFSKYRSFAMGMNYTGSTVAGFIFPQLFSFLTAEYGFQGCLLIMGAILMNMLCLCFLHHEPWWLSAKARARSRTVSFLQDQISPYDDQQENKNSVDKKQAAKPEGARVGLLESLSVLKEPILYVILLPFCCFLFAYDAYMTTIVDFAIDRGVSESKAVSIVPFYSLADMIGRLTLPTITSAFGFNKKLTICFCYTMVGLMMILLPTAINYTSLVIFAMIQSVFIGSAVVLYGVSLGDFIGPSRIPMAYGVIGLLAGSTYFAKPFYIGYFRDVVGHYDSMYMYNGLMCFLSAVMWFCTYIFSKLQERKNRIYDVTGETQP